MLKAPGPEAWKKLIGGDPLVIFLDELPPYLEYAAAVPLGSQDLGVMTTAALGNLFVAVADMDNVCVVLSDLAGTNYSIGQANLEAAFNRAVQGITAESRRTAVPITPVNIEGISDPEPPQFHTGNPQGPPMDESPRYYCSSGRVIIFRDR